VKPPPAPVSAVTSAAPPSGTGSNVSDHDAPPFAETAANGTCRPPAVVAVPAAVTVFPLAATYRSSARAAPDGSGSTTADHVRPLADSHAAGRVPAEPAATNPFAVAVTAFIWRSPSPSSAPARASVATRHPVRPREYQAAAMLPPLEACRPTITYPAGPAAAAEVTNPLPVNAPSPFADVHVFPPAEPTTTGRPLTPAAPPPVVPSPAATVPFAVVPPPTASHPEGPCVTLANWFCPAPPSTAGVAPAARAHVEPPSMDLHSAGDPPALPAATSVAPDDATALTATLAPEKSAAAFRAGGNPADSVDGAEPPVPLFAPATTTTAIPTATAVTVGMTRPVTKFLVRIAASRGVATRRAADGCGSAARAEAVFRRRMASTPRWPSSASALRRRAGGAWRMPGPWVRRARDGSALGGSARGGSAPARGSGSELACRMGPDMSRAAWTCHAVGAWRDGACGAWRGLGCWGRCGCWGGRGWGGGGCGGCCVPGIAAPWTAVPGTVVPRNDVPGIVPRGPANSAGGGTGAIGPLDETVGV
jgi:hypothetical protein